MAFTDNKSMRERSSGIAGVAIVHVGMAALLMAGLTVGNFVQPESGPLIANTFPTPPPPPPPEQAPKPEKSPANTVITAPKPPRPIPDDLRIVVPPIVDPPYSDEIRLAPLSPLDPPGTGMIGPDVAAKPRNNAANWVTDSDYKSRWIREEMHGSASFRLDIASNGRVENCRITRSTGHAALDQATCALIAKRARFNPAKDGYGNAIAGSYSGAISWVLPD